MLCLFLVSLLARAGFWLLFNSFLALLLAKVFPSGEGYGYTYRLLFCLLCITSFVSLTGSYSNDEPSISVLIFLRNTSKSKYNFHS